MVAADNFLLGVVSQTNPEIGGGNVYEQAVLAIIEKSLPAHWKMRHLRKGDIARSSQTSTRWSTLEWLPSRWRARLKHLFPSLEPEDGDEQFDLIIFLSPSYGLNRLKKVPFVTTVWDLGPTQLAGLSEFSGEYQAKFLANLQQDLLRCFRVIVDSSKHASLRSSPR